MLSKNQIRSLFNQISDESWMLNDFGWGRKWTRTEPAAPNSKIYYPILWVVPLDSDVQKGAIFNRYQIAVFDLVQEGEGNEMEVESDTFKILTDVVALLNNQSLYPDLVLDRNSINIREVEHEKYQDKLTGHACTLRIKTWYDADSCAVPGEFTEQSNPNQTNIDVNGEFFISVGCGVTYDLIVKDTNGDEVGSKVGNEWIVPTGGACADATLDVNGTSFTTIASGGSLDLPVKDDLGVVVGSKVGSEWIVPSAGSGATELELIEYANIYG